MRHMKGLPAAVTHLHLAFFWTTFVSLQARSWLPRCSAVRMHHMVPMFTEANCPAAGAGFQTRTQSSHTGAMERVYHANSRFCCENKACLFHGETITQPPWCLSIHIFIIIMMMMIPRSYVAMIYDALLTSASVNTFTTWLEADSHNNMASLWGCSAPGLRVEESEPRSVSFNGSL